MMATRLPEALAQLPNAAGNDDADVEEAVDDATDAVMTSPSGRLTLHLQRVSIKAKDREETFDTFSKGTASYGSQRT